DACWTVTMFEGEAPLAGMMEDLPTFKQSLDKLRRRKPAALHFCHDNRTWVARSKPHPKPPPEGEGIRRFVRSARSQPLISVALFHSSMGPTLRTSPNAHHML